MIYTCEIRYGGINAEWDIMDIYADNDEMARDMMCDVMRNEPNIAYMRTTFTCGRRVVFPFSYGFPLD